jgi:hypothetical protein
MYIGFAILGYDGPKEIKVATSNENKTAMNSKYTFHIGNECVELGAVKVLQLIQALQYLLANIPPEFMLGLQNQTYEDP